MRFYCSKCKAEINVSRPHSGGWVVCWQCHSRIDTPLKQTTHKTDTGIHPKLAERYGNLSSQDPLLQPDSEDDPDQLFEEKHKKDRAGGFSTIPGYEVLGTVGQGAMGTVYKARQISTGRIVALKILSPELGHRNDLVARFRRESAALRAFRHPNVVAIYDSGWANGFHYFVMEYIHGTTLRRRLKKGPLAPLVALRVIRNIMDGLVVAHSRGVIHRDIKPENILLEKRKDPNTAEIEERVVVADFGLATISSAHNPHPNLTRSRVTMGTINYMAPEQHVDAKRVDHRTDVYACGVLLYEMITGDLPLGRFQLPTERGIKVPKSVDRCIMGALEREPPNRYQSIKEFLDMLDVVESDLKKYSFVGDNPSAPAQMISNFSNTSNPSVFDTVTTFFTNSAMPTKLPAWVEKPVLVWGMAALLIGLAIGVIFGQQQPQEVVVSNGVVKPVLRLTSLGLPKFNISDKKSQPTLQFGADKNGKEAVWRSFTPAWQRSKRNLTYSATSKEGQRMRRSFSLLTAKSEVAGKNIQFGAKLALEPGSSLALTSRETHETREILGGLPEIAAGGILLVSSDERHAVGMLRFKDGKCGLAQFDKSGKTFSIRRLDSIQCGSEPKSAADLAVSCDVATGECFGKIAGKTQVSMLIEGMADSGKDQFWKPAFACQNVDCRFEF